MRLSTRVPAICLVLVLILCSLVLAAGARTLLADGDEAGPGTELIELSYGGETRSLYVHPPAGYQHGQSYPAVFAFHGGTGTGAKMERLTELSAAADSGNFIAVFPNAGDSQWNDGRSTTESDRDDVGFVLASIDLLEKQYGVDRKRVFVVGASNGGMFVYRLACDAQPHFAAFAAVVANMPVDYVSRCDPSGPLPMLIINGTDDPLMPWEGGSIRAGLFRGAGGEVISAADTVGHWRAVNGCDRDPHVEALPDRTDDGTQVVRYAFSGCQSDAELEAYEVRGGGHTWPTTEPGSKTRIGGTTSHDIGATSVIVDFFRNHGL